MTRRGAFNPNIYVTLPGDELLQPTEQEVKAAKAEAGQMRRQERVYTPEELEGYRLHRLNEEAEYAKHAAPLPANGHTLIPLVRAVSVNNDSTLQVSVRWLGEVQRDGKLMHVTVALQTYELPYTVDKDAEDEEAAPG